MTMSQPTRPWPVQSAASADVDNESERIAGGEEGEEGMAFCRCGCQPQQPVEALLEWMSFYSPAHDSTDLAWRGVTVPVYSLPARFDRALADALKDGRVTVLYDKDGQPARYQPTPPAAPEPEPGTGWRVFVNGENTGHVYPARTPVQAAIDYLTEALPGTLPLEADDGFRLTITPASVTTLIP